MKNFSINLFLLLIISIDLKAQIPFDQEAVFVYTEADYPKNIFPHNTREMISLKIASQIYEGLFKFDTKTMKPEKCLVEDYSVDSSQTVYTFKLKKEVFFHDDPCFIDGKGREMKAQDVLYCFTRLCTPDVNNQLFSAVAKDVVKGANEYYQEGDTGPYKKQVEGIKVIDDYTIQFTLYKPFALFLYNLSKPGGFIFPREALEKYDLEMVEKAVGTGPFMIDTLDRESFASLKRNPRYHEIDSLGNRLPYLSGIQVFFGINPVDLREVKSGELHYIDRFSSVIFKNNPMDSSEYNKVFNYELATHFLIPNGQYGVFKDKNLRKAIAFSLNRERFRDIVGNSIITDVHGITPPAFPFYDIKNINGYSFNEDSARYYLSLSDYKNNPNKPRLKIQLNADGNKNVMVAEEIQYQLKRVLGLDIDIEIVPLAQLLENLQSGGENILFRGGWLYDCPTPENFLWMLYGKHVPKEKTSISYPNMARYQSSEFDSWYEKGLGAKSEIEMNAAFMKAEKVLMEDSPLIVLWYDTRVSIIHKSVHNLFLNAANFIDFKTVYISK